MVIEIIFVTAQPLKLSEGLSFIRSNSIKKLYIKVKKDYFATEEENTFRFPLGKTKDLFDAVFEADLNKIKHLITQKSSLLYSYNINGLTPYTYASQLAKNDILELFLDNGLMIDSKDKNGNAMIHYCLQEQGLETIKLLVKRGATIDILDNIGKETPLAKAITFGNFKSAKLLLELGADPKVCTQDLIELASRGRGAKEMIETLIEYGVTPSKYHQETILNPEVRTAIENYFLEKDGVSANIIIKTHQGVSPQPLCSLILGGNRYTNKELLELLPSENNISNCVSMILSKIIEWKNRNLIEADIEVRAENGYPVRMPMFAVDYIQNREFYMQGGKLDFFISGIASSIKVPMEMESAYIEIFGEVKEDSFHIWAINEDEVDVEVMGRVEEIEEFILHNETLVKLKIKTKIFEEKNEFILLPIVVNKKNLHIKKVSVGDIIEAKVFLQTTLSL